MAEMLKNFVVNVSKEKDKVDYGEYMGSFRSGGGDNDEEDDEDWGNEDWDDVEAGKAPIATKTLRLRSIA